MSKEIWLGQKNIRFLYYRYKDSPYYSLFTSVFTVVVCTLLFFKVIIPQVQSWFSVRDEVIVTRKKISILRDNINFMNNIDKSVLNAQLQTVSRALPAEKDFIGVINALSDSAIHSGVSINDYTFQVGKISSTKGRENDGTKNGLPSIAISVTVNGNVNQVKNFLKELQEKLPLSQVLSIDGNTQSTIVSVVFNYKPYSTTALKSDEPLHSISDDQRILINKLSSWQPASGLPINPEASVPVSSSSPLPLF